MERFGLRELTKMSTARNRVICFHNECNFFHNLRINQHVHLFQHHMTPRS